MRCLRRLRRISRISAVDEQLEYSVRGSRLFDFVVAGFAAGWAVHQAIDADAYVDL